MLLMVMLLLPAMMDAISAYSQLQFSGTTMPASVKFFPCFSALCLLALSALLGVLECIAGTGVQSDRSNHA